MKIIEYFSYLIIPLLIMGILLFATYKKEKVYEIFIIGAIDGLKLIVKMFPTILGIVVAINIFRVSGALDLLIGILTPITGLFKIPNEVLPLGIMRSISGGASLGLLTDILSTHGPDSKIGNIASTIMGSSETTLYVFAIYTSTVGVKDTKYGIYIALLLDVIAVTAAILIWNMIM
jgi:spore maturation protein B